MIEKTELEELKSMLHNWKNTIEQQQQKAALEKNALNTEAASEIIDISNKETMLNLEFQKSLHNRKILDEITLALAKINNGIYGICEYNGEEIGVKRLKANPIARFSIEAQMDLEQQQRKN